MYIPKMLSIVLISTLLTVVIVGFEHFSPVPRVNDRPGYCCGELVYTNRHGFPFLLREDVSGGIAPTPPETQYYPINYIKLGLIVFIGATIAQLAIKLSKRSDSRR